MGSLENGVYQQQSHQSIGRVSSFPKQLRPRSRSSRSLLSKRLGYLQWISTIVVFSLFLVLFQAFLPGSVVERPGSPGKDLDLLEGDFMYLKELGELDFGEDVRFEPTRVLYKLQKEARELNLSRRGIRFAYRKPQLALVSAPYAPFYCSWFVLHGISSCLFSALQRFSGVSLVIGLTRLQNWVSSFVV